eukprot:297978_1
MMLLLFTIMFILCSTFAVTQLEFTVYYDDGVKTTMPIYYAGFTLDFWKSNHEDWANASIININFSNPDLIALASALSPSIWRIGGSPSDSTIYDISNECSTFKPVKNYQCSQVTPQNYDCLTMKRWQEINSFAIKINTSMVFGLNACFGRQSNKTAMNFSNIQQLFTYTTQQSFQSDNLFGFEFGNELQSHVEAKAYANDFYHVKQLINETFKDRNIKLIGPDLGGISHFQWDVDILNTLNSKCKENNIKVNDIMYANTFHQYADCAFNYEHISVFEMSCLHSIITHSLNYSQLANKYGVISWMGEGAEQSHGGVNNVTNRFASSFYYMYALSEYVNNGQQVELRQALEGGWYGLLNKTTTVPNPDYWCLWIWKQLIGQNVYKYELKSSNSESYVRGYAYSDKSNKKDYFTLLFINFHLSNKADISVNIKGGSDNYTYNAYHVTGGLQSDMVSLNDVKLEFKSGQFPVLKPIVLTSNSVTLDPATIVFVQLYPKT